MEQQDTEQLKRAIEELVDYCDLIDMDTASLGVLLDRPLRDFL